VSALSVTPRSEVRADDARVTFLALGLVVAPAIVVLTLAEVLLRGSAWFVPVVVAVALVLAGLLVAVFVRGPTVTRR
jgi:hypothetical protein